MPPTPPLPTDAETPSTPPTSPQRHQQAARNQERSQRLIGSPEQRRTPAIPSRPSTPPLHPPAPSSIIVDGSSSILSSNFSSFHPLSRLEKVIQCLTILWSI